MSIPKGIQFKTVKPQGFYQEWRDYFVTPVQTYTNQFNVNDIVRIQFNLQNWYIDPYESYIEAEVRLANENQLNVANINLGSSTDPVQFIMMDGPSTSLINDFRFEVNSKEIERIREYDQVGNLLTDLNMYPEAVDQKDYEGYYSIKGKQTLSQTYYQGPEISAAQRSNSASANNFSIYQKRHTLNLLNEYGMNQSAADGGIYEPFIVPYTTINSLSRLQTGAGTSNIGFISGLQAELSAPDSFTDSLAADQLLSTSDVYSMLQGIPDTQISAANTPGALFGYDTSFLGSLTAGNTNFGIQTTDYGASGTFGAVGSTTQFGGVGNIPCLYSPKMSQVDGHNIFLTNLPTSKIVQGKFVDKLYTDPYSMQTASTRAYMQIPLLSGVMGILIPSDRWQLIPSSSLGNVNMEFRFNPNAFFSHDGSKPNWIVTKFQLRLRMYQFAPEVMSQLKSQVAGGIQMHSQVFSMGPIYNIQPNVSVTNNWQLNNGIPSIKQLFFWFLANDFENYWHARKNFKLSQNITSMQLKVGSTYLPQNPIIGSAGNIVMNPLQQADNSVYLSELHQALNILFDCKKHVNINKVNFAVNDRPYDVTLQKILGTNTSTWGAKYTNVFLNTGYTLLNELRCKGKAVYAFNLEMDKRNDEIMSGLDTTKTRPIELILKNDTSNYFPRQSTMYVMFLSDFIVTFGADSTDTQGYG